MSDKEVLSIKTAEERIHPMALDDKSVWCNAYFDEVAELRAAYEAKCNEIANLKAENEALMNVNEQPEYSEELAELGFEVYLNIGQGLSNKELESLRQYFIKSTYYDTKTNQ